jgi:hypothetical protein
VLTNTETEVAALVRSEAGRGVLEVFSVFPTSQVGARQVGRAAHEFREDLGELVNGRLGELAATDSGVGCGVSGQSLLPALWQASIDTALKLGSFSGVLFAVRLEKLRPFGLELVALLRELGVVVRSLLGDGKGLVRVEAECLLELSNVVLL